VRISSHSLLHLRIEILLKMERLGQHRFLLPYQRYNLVLKNGWLVIFVLLIIFACSYHKQFKKTNLTYVPGEFFVKFKENTPLISLRFKSGIALTGIPSIDKLNKRFGVKAIERVYKESPRVKRGIERDVFGLSRIYRFLVNKEVDIQEVVSYYKLDPSVEASWPNYLPTIPENANISSQEFLVKFKLNAPTPSIKSKGGIALTGIPSIDKLNKRFGVKSIVRIFGGSALSIAEKKETIDVFGLLRCYKFILSKESTNLLPIIIEYHLDPNIESVQPIYKKGSTSKGHY